MNDSVIKERRLLKIIIELSVVISLLFGIGAGMNHAVEKLLNEALEKSVARQTSELSRIAEERFGRELTSLRFSADYLESYPGRDAEEKILAKLKNSDKGVTVGIMAINGNALYGKSLSKWDFLRLPKAFRGGDVVDYCTGKGLLFATPIKNKGNVRAIIYRL